MANGSIDGSRRGAVSLTYDGTLLCHLETVAAHLERHGLRGTFYMDPVRFLAAGRRWRDLARRGHELGLGSLLTAALPDGSLPNWTEDMIEAELEETADLLTSVIPEQTEFSFAYPKGQPRCAGETDYRSLIEAREWTARSGLTGLNRLESCDYSYLGCLRASNMGIKELIAFADTALRRHAWLVIAFDGVGVGEPAVDAATHEALCAWLAGNRERGIVDTVVGVRAEVQGRRGAFRLA